MTLNSTESSQFVSILSEYFKSIKTSPLCSKLENNLDILNTGFNTILNVYNYSKELFKNGEELACSQQAHYFYVEYIEQIYNTNLNYALNHNDAVIFVYKKTLFDLYTKAENISGYINTGLQTNDIKCQTASMVMYWENLGLNIEDHEHICNYYIPKFLNMNDELLKQANHCLYMIKSSMRLTYNEYIELLDNIVTKFEKNISKKTQNYNNDFETQLLFFYMYKNDIETLYQKNDFENIVSVIHDNVLCC